MKSGVKYCSTFSSPQGEDIKLDKVIFPDGLSIERAIWKPPIKEINMNEILC